MVHHKNHTYCMLLWLVKPKYVFATIGLPEVQLQQPASHLPASHQALLNGVKDAKWRRMMFHNALRIPQNSSNSDRF